ncbi:hypothetical protein CNEO2_570024 [Clostridium neonatale]|nr:hypothetical protein CNEO2_570024 [Clostridium neonatale]
MVYVDKWNRSCYAPKVWALGHAFHSMLLGLCEGRQDHLGPALPANTYL